MKTIDCSTLHTLIKNHERVDLIDIRPRKEFAAMHIPGARSLPFAELAAPHIFLRPRPTTERVYIISDDNSSASLAIGILRSSGRINAVVVDGGMKAWIAQGFPVLRDKFFARVSIFLGTGAILPGLAAAVALARYEVFIGALLLVIAAALILKANSFARMQSRRSDKLDPAHNYKILPTRHGSGLLEEVNV